jgi:hypothetical protein
MANKIHPGGKDMANIHTGVFPVNDTADDGFAGTSPVKPFPPNEYDLTTPSRRTLRSASNASPEELQ